MSHEERRRAFFQRRVDAELRKVRAEATAERERMMRRQEEDVERRLRARAEAERKELLEDIADANEETAWFTREQFNMDLMRDTQQWAKDNLGWKP